jgi:transcriptional regulator with XRE-family HTH domain
MPSSDAITRNLLRSFGSAILSARVARHWSQRRLAAASGVSQSLVARLEHALMPDVPIATVVRVLTPLDVEVDLRLLGPRPAEVPQRDRAHSRCVAYVARRLERAGYLVATEVEVGNGRWLGFVDVLAFVPRSLVLLVIEVKTEIIDVGAIDRQLGSYERAAWGAAQARGWRPRALISALLVLATQENDRRLAENRAHFDRAFPLRARSLVGLVERLATEPFGRGMRGLAMVDPASRRKAWLLPTWLDGRRTPARYADRADYLARGAGRS